MNIWVAGAMVLVVAILLRILWPESEVAKVKRLNSKKKYQEKYQEWRESQQKALKDFYKNTFVVYIRERDGRKTAFEATLIGYLAKNGASIKVISENDGRALANGDAGCLKDGELAIIGTAWSKTETMGNYGDGPLFYDSTTWHCDYRLLKNIKGSGLRIVAAGSDERGCYLEMDVVRHLVEILTGIDPHTGIVPSSVYA